MCVGANFDGIEWLCDAERSQLKQEPKAASQPGRIYSFHIASSGAAAA